MDKNLLTLIQSLDPLFPTGGYTLSNGMETYVRDGVVYDSDSLKRHLSAYLYALSYNDLAFAAKAYNGIMSLEYLDFLFSAVRAPRELRDASIRQCARFLKLQTAIGSYPLLKKYASLIKTKECAGHYPIAMGLFIRETGVDLDEALSLYCYSILSSMANHAVKLVPMRQLDGQTALYKAVKEIPEAVKTAKECGTADLGISGAGQDLSSMRHEILDSRLYIS